MRMIIDTLNEKFPSLWNHSDHVTVDESSEACKSCLDYIMFNSNKLIKRGIKIWSLCDSKSSKSCYLLCFEPYFGKKHTTISQNGLYFDIFTRLAKLIHGKNVKLL